MAHLTPEQRDDCYRQAADRVGIHKSLLAALYATHHHPALPDGEVGLGIIDTLEPLDTFAQQVLYAAHVIRVMEERLIAQSWQAKDLWHFADGRYSDRFLALIADGFTPAVEDTEVGVLPPCDRLVLQAAYERDIERDWLPEDLSHLDDDLLHLIARLPEVYSGFSHQRQALLEAVRIWRNLRSPEAAIESLAQETNKSLRQLAQEDLDITLKQFLQRTSLQYQGYPYQREAWLRLVQYWRQLPSREATLLSLLADPQPHADLFVLDAALLHFVQQIPLRYERKGVQRNALTEGFRVWRQLDSRSTALAQLGVDPDILTKETCDPELLTAIAHQLDQELLNFVDRVPLLYAATHQQREALMRMVQLWRDLPTREQTIHSLTTDLKHLEHAIAPSQMPPFTPAAPETWTVDNLELSLPIVPDGHFLWAEATQCGTCLPPNQCVVEAIITVAHLLERAQQQVGIPFLVNRWYQPLTMQRSWKGPEARHHALGNGVEILCPGLMAKQIYWLLDPWWPGGLGCYPQYPHLCHLDARSHRARWGCH